MCWGPYKNVTWVCPCFSTSVPRVLFILLGWFLRWEVDGRIPVVLWGVASRICLIYLVAFLFHSYLVSSLCVLSTSMWYIHKVVLNKLLLERNHVLFYRIEDMFDCQSIAVSVSARRMLTSLSVDEIMLPKYANFSINFRGLPLRLKMAPRLKLTSNIFFAFT